MRLLYRTRQFLNILFAAPGPGKLADARRILSPSLMALFLSMQASEQTHSLRIFTELLEQGETNSDLLVAALLHDVGKSRSPLRPWERVWIVLGKALFSNRVKRWGKGEPRGWRRPFVIAEQHPAWGAEMAAQAGASPLAVALIQRHQEPLLNKHETLEDWLLSRLQLLDNEN